MTKKTWTSRTTEMGSLNLYHTSTPNPFKSASYSRTCPGTLRPFKCSVHSCRGLELWLRSLSPH